MDALLNDTDCTTSPWSMQSVLATGVANTLESHHAISNMISHHRGCEHKLFVNWLTKDSERSDWTLRLMAA